MVFRLPGLLIAMEHYLRAVFDNDMAVPDAINGDHANFLCRLAKLPFTSQRRLRFDYFRGVAFLPVYPEVPEQQFQIRWEMAVDEQ